MEQVTVLGPPEPNAGGPYLAPEGGLITLDSSASTEFGAEGDAFLYEWDIDADGIFGDVVGKAPELSWSDLKGFGLDDGYEVYGIALRITNVTSEVSNDAFSTITIEKAPPEITLTGGLAAEVGQEFTIGFSATDWGDDTILQWAVDWGDGTEDALASDAEAATHTYLATGDFNIEVTATDEDGSYVRNMLVRAVAAQPDPGGPYQIREGQNLSLYAAAPGSPSFAWDLNADGYYGDGSGMEAHLAWDDLVGFGLRDNGLYVVSVRITYPVGDGMYNVSEDSTTLTILNAPPTALFSNDGPVDEGYSVTVRFFDPGDPSPVDASGPFTYRFDLDNDGDFEIAGAAESATFTVPDSGSQVVRGRIGDKDGDYTEYVSVVTAREVAPSLTVSGVPQTVNEGSEYTLNLSATDPGADTISQWRVNWGDGAIQDVTDLLVTHVFPDDGMFQVLVTAIDEDGVYTTTHTVQVVNAAPTIVADASQVTVQEGEEGTNSGTCGDPGADALTLSASVGSVLDNGDGTWTWSYTPSDGPDDSQTVRITVTDDDGGPRLCPV